MLDACVPHQRPAIATNCPFVHREPHVPHDHKATAFHFFISKRLAVKLPPPLAAVAALSLIVRCKAKDKWVKVIDLGFFFVSLTRSH